MLCCILLTSLFLLTGADNPPHVIFILADDLGWNDVGFHGSNQIPTPNIDALAYSGVILNNYYVMPICTPSRSALLTGRHPIHTGMQHRVIVANEPWGLSLTEKLLPEYLKEKGYATHIVGKWHLGHFSANYTPTYRGFDSHYGYWTGHQDYYDHTAEDQQRFWGYDMRSNMDVHWRSYGHYTTDLFTDKAVQLVKEHDTSRPLFLYLAHLATHSANPYLPLQAPADVVTRFRHIRDVPRRIFAGMVTKLDQSVGAVVSALGARGMLNNSIIIFSTDNGGPAAGFNENAASNWPLRGVKDTQWEGGVRGVGLIWSPLIGSAPRVATHLMHIQDWLPTLLRAVNSSFAGVKVDGQDLWDAILRGDSSKAYDELLVNIDNDRAIAALRKGDWKIILGNTRNGDWDGWYGPSGRDTGEQYNLTLVRNSPAGRAIATTSAPLPADKRTLLKLRKEANVNCKTPGEFSSPVRDCVHQACLFDLRSDPCELEDQALNKPDKVTELLTILRRYNETVVPARNKPADPRSNPKFWGYTWTTWMDMVKKTV